MKPGSQRQPDTERTLLCKIPVFRPVAINLLTLLSNEDVNILDVAELLRSDPGFGAEFLTTANSAVYAVRGVNTIEHAVFVLGIDRTKVLVTRAALQGMVRGMEENAAIKNCWLHSRATATIAGWLSRFYRLNAELAYTVGLMHDIGRLGLLAVHPVQYAELLSRITGNNLDLMQAEQVLFSVDHCEAGAWLTRTWGLPKEFGSTGAHHHQPFEGASGDPADLVKMACALAQALGFASAPLVGCEPVESILQRVPNSTGLGQRFCLSDLSTLVENDMLAGLKST